MYFHSIYLIYLVNKTALMKKNNLSFLHQDALSKILIFYMNRCLLKTNRFNFEKFRLFETI